MSPRPPQTLTTDGNESYQPADREQSCWPVEPDPSAVDLTLGPSDIHIWTVPLDPPPHVVARLRQRLAPDELQRADRFRFDKHRRHYTVGRGVLRRLLGLYLGRGPQDVHFRYGDKDKPHLADDAETGLYFNLSNSEDMALVGVTRHGEIGVDIEHLRPMPDGEQIAERFFSIPERDVLRGVPEDQKHLAFFNCWTRKEAYIKAVGDGLSMALDRFDVTLAPGDPAKMLSCEGSAEQGAAWYLEHLEPWQGYVGAVCLLGSGFELTCRQWPVDGEI